MNRIILFLVLMLVVGCGEQSAEKPKNLIGEDKMEDILYDLSVLEALKSQKPLELANGGVDHTTYIYEKYKIDSTQLAASNRYYASDVDNYKKIYERVREKLEVAKRETQVSSGSSSDDNDSPRVQ